MWLKTKQIMAEQSIDGRKFKVFGGIWKNVVYVVNACLAGYRKNDYFEKKLTNVLRYVFGHFL